MEEPIKMPWYFKAAAMLLLITLIIFGMIVAKPILVPLAFAIVVAVLLTPLANYMEKYKIPRFVSAFLSILVAVTFVAGLIFFSYNQIIGFADDISLIEDRLNELFDQFNEFISYWFEVEPDAQLESLEETVVSFLRDNVEAFTRGMMTAATTITMFFLIPIYVFLLLIFRDFLKEFVFQALDRDNQGGKVERVVYKVKDVLQNYIVGMFIVICILAVINSIMLLIIGVNHAVFFAVFAAVLNVIPFVGPILGSILPAIYSLLTMDSLIYPAAILLGFYIVQLFESNLFTPTIVGSRVSLNPLVTLLAIFIGGQIWGLAGMILFIPAGAMMKEIFDEVETMKPYGFLLGSVSHGMAERRSAMAKKIHEYSERLQQKEKERGKERKKSGRKK